eukprot:s871_g4.t2
MSPRRHRLRNAFKAACGLSAALTLHCFVSPPSGPLNGVAERRASEPPLRRPAAPTGAETERGRGPALDGPKEDRVPAAAGANVLSWVLSGLSAVYLAQFASFYCQCPGLIGSSGLQPLLARPEDVDRTWLLHFFSSPELGVEAFALVGTVLAALQLAMPQAVLRHGPAGATIYAFLWWCWHDLVIAGGRFTCYQMDVIVLDAAPLTILAALGLETQATVFGLRWLLLRLYLGGGAVKLLSCDESWRNLSALHWHFQSQPLPNPLGNAAHLFMPDSIRFAVACFSLGPAARGAPSSARSRPCVDPVCPRRGDRSPTYSESGEDGLAFLFLAPAADVRRIAFALQTALQGGIVMAGNFGSFNFMTVIIALSLLEDEDLPPAPALATRSSGQVVPTKLREELVPAVSLTSVLLAAGATAWTLHNQGANCGETWGAQPMVWAALLLVPFVLAATVETWLGLLLAVVFFLGSAAQLAGGLGVLLPAEELLQIFDFGAARYGLFARMSGVGGRPTEVLEGSLSPSGPWATVPFRYQVVETTRQPPFCFPHFPRLDWTYWFVPLGSSDGDLQGWLGQFLSQVQMGNAEVLNLLDRPEFEQRFPDGPPQFLRISPRTFLASLPGEDGAWWVSKPANMNAAAWADMPEGSILEKPALLAALPPALVSEPTPWLDAVGFMIAAPDLAQTLFVSYRISKRAAGGDMVKALILALLPVALAFASCPSGECEESAVVQVRKSERSKRDLMIGYWAWAWNGVSDTIPGPANQTMGICFSGYTDAQTNLNYCISQGVIPYICSGSDVTCTKWMTVGGAGTTTDRTVLSGTVGLAASIRSAGFDGVIFDSEYVEAESTSTDLIEDFYGATANLSAAGLMVGITTSHSAPLGCTNCNAAEVVEGWLADPNLDWISPQLYSNGYTLELVPTSDCSTESPACTWDIYENAIVPIVPSVPYAYMYDQASTVPTSDCSTESPACTWDIYENAIVPIVPSVPYAYMYDQASTNAVDYFKDNYNITLQGYIQWIQEVDSTFDPNPSPSPSPSPSPKGYYGRKKWWGR